MLRGFREKGNQCCLDGRKGVCVCMCVCMCVCACLCVHARALMCLHVLSRACMCLEGSGQGSLPGRLVARAVLHPDHGTDLDGGGRTFWTWLWVGRKEGARAVGGQRRWPFGTEGIVRR